MPNLKTSTLLALLSLPLALTQQITHIVTMTSTIAPTTITLAAAAAANTPSNYPSSSDLTTQILNSTNFYRYIHPAPYLQWNTSLASFAQSYSSNCKWAHNSAITSLRYGENLAMGYPDVATAVDAWGDEASMYTFSTKGYTGFTEATGHFSQLVWRGTRTVGCGWTDCSSSHSGGVDGVLLVCNYFPAGNVMAAGEDENLFFKQNVVAEKEGGGEGFDAQEAGRGVGGPSGTETESVAGTVTASALAVGRVRVGGAGWGVLGSLGVVSFGMLVGGWLV